MANLEINSEIIDQKKDALTRIADDAFTVWHDSVTKLESTKAHAESILANAKTEADQILSDAKARVETILSHAKTEAHELVSSVEKEVSEHEETQTAKYITAAEEYKKEYIEFRDTHKLNDALLTVMGYPPIVKGVLSRSVVVKLFKQRKAQENPPVTDTTPSEDSSKSVESTVDADNIDDHNVTDNSGEDNIPSENGDSRSVWKRRIQSN